MRPKVIPMVCLALLAGACASSGSGGDGPRVVPLEGEVLVVRGSDQSRVTEPEELAFGDSVRTGPDGWAFVELPGEQGVELAPASELGIGGADRMEVAKGHALFHAPDGMTVASGPAEMEAAGNYFRVDRYVGVLRLGVYSGSATVQGWDGRVDALEQVGVSAGIVPQAPEPLSLDPGDRWDGRLLGEAMDLGADLADIARGLETQVPPGADLGDVARYLPKRFPVRAAQPRLHSLSAAEGLVAAMVAFEAARADGRSPISVLRDVLALRELGAEWSIVVARWRLLQSGVLTALAAITDLVASILVPGVAPAGSTPSAKASATLGGSGGGAVGGSTSGPGSSTGTAPQPDASGGGSSGGGGGDTGGGGGDTGGNEEPTEEPPPEEPPPPPPSCSSQLECTVQDVLDGPLGPGGLGGLG
jgi:hypothetical protein